ncbi:unnamed protein product [Cuscuta europaea]|uniref:Uncharacterized protein n=1 Tax=Cuscuta europaea TaxID=41803 RepID=A0A9P1ECL3_CUSEU|nr:unnamed protein product [Cuscuta europaea]
MGVAISVMIPDRAADRNLGEDFRGKGEMGEDATWFRDLSPKGKVKWVRKKSTTKVRLWMLREGGGSRKRRAVDLQILVEVEVSMEVDSIIGSKNDTAAVLLNQHRMESAPPGISLALVSGNLPLQVAGQTSSPFPMTGKIGLASLKVVDQTFSLFSMAGEIGLGSLEVADQTSSLRDSR